MSDWEGCLSIPDIRGIVPRWQAIGVEALNMNGEALSFEVRGFPARVIQHEVDHLDGILYLDRMENLRTLSFLDESVRFAPEASESSDAADK
jgi:peptide deformylase